MNRDQARALVRDTFTRSFDKAGFRNFAINLLNKFDESKAFFCNSTYVKDAFKEHVSRFERLGTYTSPESEKLDVLIVHLTNESKLERARTAIRNFVADHLKQHDNKDAALVAFVSPTEQQWRFSYVKMEYATVQKESGKIGVESRLTPARRFSYIVGEGESCHTAQTRFLDLLQDTENNPTLALIEDAFSVEAVTKEFFAQYRKLFEDINAGLDKLAVKDKAIRDEFQKKHVKAVDFAKKLMGQVVFLYFLQKKGWLGVAKGKDWGTGPHDFLRRLAGGKYGSYENLFNDILEPLFYDTLATDRGHEAWCNRFQSRIPFLNGGLFEPLGNYNWKKTDIILPNTLFTNSEFVEESITGTGVLDVFDRYNFTVNEAEPLEKEVAIDPEMLGKVFENLIEDNRRKGLGSYYTPREIVHYMCQESLINYLDTALNTAEESPIPTNPKQTTLLGEPEPEQTGLKTTVRREIISRGEIEAFVHLGEQASLFETARLSGTVSYRPQLPKSIEEHARLIDEKLADITVCDPAVGSGAFPVGMMTEIVRARSALTPYFNDVHDRTPYHFKRHAIQNCLYGVDIDPGAVEIAKLRLWLSLVVDEEDVKQIKPLPNLFYKVVTGNSLLGVEKNLFNERIFQRLEELKPRYFDEPDKDKKDRYKQQIDDTIHELTNGKEDFDFEIYFSEVFHRKGGFDVLIANPPYGADLSEFERRRLENKFPFVPDYESYDYFICIGLELLTTGGFECFIVPNTWLINRYAKRFRNHLLETYTILRIDDCSDFSVFESANVRNTITMLSKTPPASNYALRLSLFSSLKGHIQSKDVESKELRVRLDNWLTSFSAADSKIVLADKIRNQGTPLSDFADSSQGLIPYDKYRGHNEYTIKNRIWHATRKKNKTYRRELQGKDVDRYLVQWNGETWISYGIWLAAPREPRFFKSERILIREITNPRILAGYTKEEFYNTPSIINVVSFKKLSPFFILGLINSRLLSFYHFETSPKSKKGLFPKILVNDVRCLPIKDVSSKVQAPIIELVKSILKDKERDPSSDTTDKDREIDQLVYALYGLTPDEIKLVEDNAQR
ncbi:MAG: TaqI-like C-terminal specificity domain-containing protein [Nitrospira sp.]|nr:TaqI-like C-terminal specificity domain-containing protein [Nitrospira sp.]